MRLLISLLILAVIGFAAAPARSEGGRWELAKAVKEEKMQQIYDQLGLSGSQKKQLEKNRQKNHQDLSELRQKIREIKKQIRQSVAQPDLDRKDLDRMNAELNQLQSQYNDLRVQGILEVRKILTEEQIRLFNQLIDK